jgi:hypothetical protein
MKDPLPAAFAALEQFVPVWALDTQDARSHKRRTSSREELREFYEAMLPHMESILTELDRFPLGGLGPSHRPLYALLLSLAEIAPNIELYRGDPLVPHSFTESRMLSMHGGEPTWKALQPSR